MTTKIILHWFVSAIGSLFTLMISFVKSLFGFPATCIRHLSDGPADIAFKVIRPLKRIYRDSLATNGQSLIHRRVYC